MEVEQEPINQSFMISLLNCPQIYNVCHNLTRPTHYCFAIQGLGYFDVVILFYISNERLYLLLIPDTNVSSSFLWRYFNRMHCSLQRRRNGPESGEKGLKKWTRKYRDKLQKWTREWETSWKVCGESSCHDWNRGNFQKTDKHKRVFWNRNYTKAS